MARKDLAAILVEEKILAQRDVERLERERAQSGQPLWSILFDAELITEEELFFLLGKRWQMAADAALEKVESPEAVRRVWGRDEARAHGMLPVEIEGNRVTVLMVDPSDEKSLLELVARLKMSEARVLLARRALIERAIARIFGGAGEKQKAKPPLPGRPQRPRGKTEPKVQIDPALAEELQRLPARALEADALTPMPRMRRRRLTAPGEPAAPPFTLEDALRAEERLSRALLQAVELLSRELEQRLAAENTDERLSPELSAGEMARLSRRVARKLGLDRRSADEVGAAAYLFAIDRKLRRTETRATDWFGELGWAGANEEGLLSVLRALTATAAGFSRTSAGAPLGARIITVVDDYLQLGAATSEAEDLGTVSQLLRTSPAGAPVVDALLRVLESERVTDPTPATTITAEPLSDDKTQRKAAPTAPPAPARARREKE